MANRVIKLASKSLRLFCLSIAMFILVYSTPIVGVPSFITTYKAVALVALFFCIVKKPEINSCSSYLSKVFSPLYFCQFALLAYVLFIEFFVSGRGDGDRIADNLIDTIIYLPIIIFSFYRLFESNDSLMSVMVIISVVQSVIIILGILFPSFRSQINYIFNSNENNYYVLLYEDGWNYLAELGYATGIACIGSKGVLQLSLGMIGCLYKITHKGSNLYLLFLLFIGFAATAVARSGLVILLFAMILLMFYYLKNNLKKMFKLLLLFFLLTVIILILVNSIGIDSLFSSTFRRLVKTFQVGIWDSFLYYYFFDPNTMIPVLNSDTFWGIGITSGVAANGVRINVDGEFIRVFFALGPIMFTVNYFVLYRSIIKKKKVIIEKSDHIVFSFCFFILIYAQFKEFFIYNRYFISCFFLFILFVNKEYHFSDKTISERNI